ncbi:hypothetical protein HK097_007295 [Rhizophlyctis rosea]|uniref:histidine kinase n=1 Tax=Rhizophlyctis rosea TaxID=64517 RepID=A0AAD5SE03_9FUNG|nr:hypothetical protein HK097_007295 [Rhizophlyctis rosea]
MEVVREEQGFSVSRKLRTPLHDILSTLELLFEDPALSPSHRGMLHVVQASGKSLHNIINGLLDFHKWEVGIRVSTKVVDVGNLAQDVMDAFSLDVPDRVKLTMHVEVNGVLQMDGSLLCQILMNLVENSVKVLLRRDRRPEHSRNRRCHAMDGHRHRDRDERGIPGEGLYVPFSKEDSFTHALVGIGLSITRKLVMALGGTIDVQSEQGVGTAVTATLPLLSAGGLPRYNNVVGYYVAEADGSDPDADTFLMSVRAAIRGLNVGTSGKVALELHNGPVSLPETPAGE